MEKKYDVIIIGAGASGMMAAIFSSRKKKKVLLLERNDRAGKKLSMTGNGKCNFTNLDLSPSVFHSECTDSLNDIKGGAEFRREVLKVFSAFSNEDIIKFFDSIGIMSFERNGYFYPYSGDAKSFRDLYYDFACESGAEFLFNKRVISVKHKECFIVKTEENTYFSDSLIISAGGLSYPKTGSTGDSYTFAKSFEVPLTKTLPSLVPLKLGKEYSSSLEGIRCHAKASLILEEKAFYSEIGEIQFNKDNVSGLPILSFSGMANRLISLGKKPCISFDFFPEISEEMLTKKFYQYFSKSGKNRKFGEALKGYLPYKIIPFILLKAGISIDDSFSDSCENFLENLVSTVKDLRISVIGSLGFDRAQTTTGGVPLSEIDISTMEAKKVPGLYFTGEALDSDGICGGFNLSWAFATGYIAGNSV